MSVRLPPAEDLVAALDARLPMARQLFEELRTRTTDGEGVTRPSYGAGEQVGHDLMRTAATSIGLEVTTDAAGNLYATLPGVDRTAPRWISGSHFDLVPRGGNYDGAAGAIGALVAVAALKDLGLKPRQDITAMAIRAEECSSWFSGQHGGHLGSRRRPRLARGERARHRGPSRNRRNASPVDPLCPALTPTQCEEVLHRCPNRTCKASSNCTLNRGQCW